MRTVEQWARKVTIPVLTGAIIVHKEALKRVSSESARKAMRSELRVMRRVLAERSK
jgi:hypothetical protein